AAAGEEVAQPATDVVLVGALVDRVLELARLEIVELLGDDRQRLGALTIAPPVDTKSAPTHDHERCQDDRGQNQSSRDVVGEDLAGSLDGAEHPLPHGN